MKPCRLCKLFLKVAVLFFLRVHGSVNQKTLFLKQALKDE